MQYEEKVLLINKSQKAYDFTPTGGQNLKGVSNKIQVLIGGYLTTFKLNEEQYKLIQDFKTEEKYTLRFDLVTNNLQQLVAKYVSLS